MRKARFYYEKKNDQLSLCGLAQMKMFSAWEASIPDKTIIEAVFQKQRHSKTLAQLGYWFGVLLPFASEVLREAGHDTLFDVAVGELKTGVETNPTTTDLLFKTLFAAHKQLGKVPLKRNMTDEQMSELIDFAMTWLARNLGAVAPEPERDSVPLERK